MSVRKVCECSVLRVALVVWTLTLGGAGAAEETGGRTLPAEDQATVDAYLDWAAFLRLQHDASTATAMEDRAGTLRKASRTPTSLTIGFDPYRELQDYASALEAAGDAAKARRVQDVAQAYREEQVLRLTMHGGKVLDPWRYMGRPRNYERQLPGMLEARYSLRGPGFLANHPPGADWVMESVEPVVFSKAPAALAGRRAVGHTFYAIITSLDPAPALKVTAEYFPRAVEEQLRTTYGEWLRVTNVVARHRGRGDEYCADYDLSAEDREKLPFPGVVFDETHHGFVCLDASRPIVVLAYYSESRPQGSATIVSPAYRAEAEAFLRSIAVTPRQAPMARDAEGPASRQ